MTRLERHQQRETRNRTLIFGGIVLVLVIFFLTVGIPMFVNLSGNFGKMLGGGAKTTDKGKSLEFSTVEINNIPEATNSATLIVGGTVSNIDNLTVYLNGSADKKVEVSGKSDFNLEISGLKSGSNEIYASGSLKGSNTVRESQKYTVVYRADKPNLEITAPADNSSTPRDEIQVIGNTDANADLTVKVNGQPTVLATGGHFQSTVKLKEGENKIVVTVTDTAGNSEEKTVTVKYEK
jgi:hypothetical protein